MTASDARRAALGIAAIAIATVSCKDSSGPESSGPLPPRIRIVNSVYQGAAASAVPLNIDYMIDGQPAAAGLPGNSVSAGSPPGGYFDTSVGVHSLVARVQGKSSPVDSLYTTPTGSPWVPRLYLTANSHYTIVVSGVIPAGGTFNNSVPFAALVDDPFPPIKVNGSLQARFRVINAAPFAAVSGNGATINVFVTPGSTPPPVLTTLTALTTAGYRNASAYLNVDPGTYTLTLAVVGAGTILSQSTVTLSAGEVRSFILQSTGPRSPVGSANNKLTPILDRQY